MRLDVNRGVGGCAAVFAVWLCAFPAPAAAQEKSSGVPAAKKTWAFRPPVRPPLPAVKKTAWVRNPIDAFILARLEARGLTPAPAADPARLIRRLSFDLTGLPPTPQEVDAFVKDRSPDAYEKLVDRLLASPRYGERWALFWLDLVRYAESDGFKADDIRPNAWRYRDYVIRSFNADKPYDRFLREQLAGDELYPDDPEAWIATGFPRHFPDEYNARNLEQRRQEILNDITDTTSQVFLGLTVGCARCHDHKFDPILQTDYYRLQAFFAAFAPREVAAVPAAEQQARQRKMQDWLATTAALRGRLEALEEPYRRKLVNTNKVKYPASVQEAFDTPPDQRTPLHHQLADMVAKQLHVGPSEMSKAMSPDVRKQWQDLGKQMAAFERAKPRPLPAAMALTDVGPIAPATYLLQRGEWRRKGAELAPGFLSIIDDKPVQVPAPAAGAKTTGRRTVLAQWLTHPNHPLTARVIVNRLWQHHFGRGIVATPSDFGEQGEAPTHPELLDWLAREFIERGWSLKAMHRLMVTSATYRQTAQGGNVAAAKVDSENRLLWRMNRRRLEGETLRDAMLAVSGLLNLKAGGPSIFPELPAELGVPRGGWPVTADVTERNRRSIYVFVKRNLRYPLFNVFDAPDSNETCARRHVSTNAPQALMLLNSKLTLDLARSFAGRVLRETTEPDRVIEAAYRLALGRAPDQQERQLLRNFLDRQTEYLRTRTATAGGNLATPLPPVVGADTAFGAAVVDLCQALFNVNGFLYID
jgi:hypothetical protein